MKIVLVAARKGTRYGDNVQIEGEPPGQADIPNALNIWLGVEGIRSPGSISITPSSPEPELLVLLPAPLTVSGLS